MKASRTVLAAMAAVVTLTSVAAAGPGVAKQRVAIRAKGVLNQGALTPSGFGEFVLTPLEAGALVRDSGTITTVWRPVRVRSGHRLVGHDAVSTLKGKRGSIFIGLRVEWVDTGGGSHLGRGVWNVLGGTGQYARIAGGGRSGDVWLDRGPWSSRVEGVVTPVSGSLERSDWSPRVANRPLPV
jgi:hypothetical protein